MQLTQQERRIFERLSISKMVYVTFNGQEQKVQCKDVNSEGLSLYLSDNSLKIDDEVAIRFEDQDVNFPALNADADVIRVQPMEGTFLIALEFIAIY